jgi:alpha-beta hydrolase superfamily lysophospholipase
MATYHPDVLGPDFEQLLLPQAPDYEGAVVSTLVRLKPTADHSAKAVLYVHGFNDYFFQQDMARRFQHQGYQFYALDLRKYGRSLRPHQRPNNVRDLREYFADLDAALAVVRAEAGDVPLVLCAHSTGGLIAALYAQENPGRVTALVLNSPFLAMNLPRAGLRALPLVAALGRRAPDLPIPGKLPTTYGQSLHRQYWGEWDYDLAWKPLTVFPVNAGWLRAITAGHRRVQQQGLTLALPVLVLHSDASVKSPGWSDEFFRADGVLNVEHIRTLAPRLGTRVTVRAIAGGLHDLVLSREPVREQVYREVFAWLTATLG